MTDTQSPSTNEANTTNTTLLDLDPDDLDGDGQLVQNGEWGLERTDWPELYPAIGQRLNGHSVTEGGQAGDIVRQALNNDTADVPLRTDGASILLRRWLVYWNNTSGNKVSVDQLVDQYPALWNYLVDHPRESLWAAELALRWARDDPTLYVNLVDVPKHIDIYKQNVEALDKTDYGCIRAIDIRLDTLEKEASHRVAEYVYTCENGHTHTRRIDRFGDDFDGYRDCPVMIDVDDETDERCGASIEEEKRLYPTKGLVASSLISNVPGTESEKIVGEIVGDIDTQIESGKRVRVVALVREDIRAGKHSIGTFIQVVGIQDLSPTSQGVRINDEDIERAQEIANREDTISYLASGIAPSLEGKQYEHLRKALLLTAVSGVTRETATERFRGKSHMAIVGEPDTGKSTLIRAMEAIVPSAELVNGETTSEVGLTASLTASDDRLDSNDWVLSAGAIPRANGSQVYADEFQELGNLDSLRTAMSEGEISVKKANVKATLETNTSVVLTGNPENDTFDMTEPIDEQIREKMSPAMMSRLDLIYVLLADDDINEELEQKKLASSKGLAYGTETTSRETAEKSEITVQIALARERDVTGITEAGNQYRDETWLELNKKYDGGLGNRYLDAIDRLAQASARLNLRDAVDVVDIQIARNLIEISLDQVGGDVNRTGREIDDEEKEELVVQTAQDLASQQGGKSVETDALIEVVQDDYGISEAEARDIISNSDKLNRNGAGVYHDE